MRICRYADGSAGAFGVVVGDQVRQLDGDPFGPCRPGAPVGDLGRVRLLAPCTPSKVVCAGRNYRSLLAEQGRDLPDEPFLFLKASTAVVGPGARVYLPGGVTDLAHEGELAVVVGRRASRLTESDAAGAVLGYTCANDLTVRDWQGPSRQWVRAKSSDTHCPLGPWIETELDDPADVRVRTTVNGVLRQDGRTSDLVFGIGQLLAYITAHMTLLPGDVVLTGTSAGIRPVRAGDVMRVEVEGVGALTNPVVDWPTDA
ncbi:MAG TPA: fumarylacetoacetate hydrolase family protein [Mycobacteriales bacterium]|nr:fumarylacetoacetate hydrolase family protein [Mycobacteriales bacterium]